MLIVRLTIRVVFHERNARNIFEFLACHGVQRLLDSEGTITSPGYDEGNNYPTELICKWVIFGPTGSTVSLTFEEFSLEESKKCNYYDYLTIKERCTGQDISGNLGGRPDGYCGSYKPPVINSTCNELHITFYSDDSDTARGFKAKYRMNKDTGKKPHHTSTPHIHTRHYSTRTLLHPTHHTTPQPTPPTHLSTHHTLTPFHNNQPTPHTTHLNQTLLQPNPHPTRYFTTHTTPPHLSHSHHTPLQPTHTPPHT